MQKNRFVNEDIKAVCSSAAKKLFSLGVWGAVSIALVPNTALAGGCHSRFGRRQATQNHTETERQQPTQNHMEPATHNTTVGTRFLVAGRGLPMPPNPDNLIIVYPGDRLITDNGGVFEIENRYVNWTVTARTNRIEYNRNNRQNIDNASVNSHISPGMAALLGDFTMPNYLREEFEQTFGYKPPK